MPEHVAELKELSHSVQEARAAVEEGNGYSVGKFRAVCEITENMVP